MLNEEGPAAKIAWLQSCSKCQVLSIKMKTINPNSEKHPIAIGYWKEQDHLSFPDPIDFVNANISPQLRAIVSTYLENGKPFIPYLGYSWCRFRCGIEDHKMGSYSFTDGDYVWPEGLSHYLKNHDVWLPDIFIEHVLQNPNKDCSLVNLNKLDIQDYSWWETWSKVRNS